MITQVFKAKLQQFQEALPSALKGGGKIYKIHVVEFQKRGTDSAISVLYMDVNGDNYNC